jgi:cell division protein FtsI/penicillin-binding protein 2
MVSAVATIANDGLLMKPYVVKKVVAHDEGRTIEVKPQVVRRAVSADTADVLTQMLATALEVEESLAIIPGYRVAGKTGTASIPIPGGYHPTLTITSFAGYFPVDDPQVVILVILNKPTVSKWGNQSAAPTFRRIGERLISLLDIPPDEIRLVRNK